MPRRRFTAAEIERVRIGYRRFEKVDDIAAAIGATRKQVYNIAERCGFSSMARLRVMTSERMRAAHANPDDAQVKAFKASQRDPENMRRRLDAMRAAMRRPGTRAKITHTHRKIAAAKHGCEVPAALWPEYQALLRKDFSPREARVILGLIPQPDQSGAQA